MAGKPETTRRLAVLNEPENADYIFERIEGGEPLDRVAMRLSDKLNEHISRKLLSDWLDQPENKGRFADALTRAGTCKAEQVVSDAEALVRNVALGLMGRDDVAAARLAADANKWIAGIWNKEYAPQTGAQVTLNIGEVHMASLRQAPSLMPPRPRELEIFDVEDVEPVMLGTTGHLTLDDL